MSLRDENGSSKFFNSVPRPLKQKYTVFAFFMIAYLLMICTAFANSKTWVVALLNVVIFHVVVLNVAIHIQQAIVIVLRNVNLPYKTGYG